MRLLEAFRKQYGGENPFYDLLAEQRISALRKTKYEDYSRRLVRSFTGHSDGGRSAARSVAFSPDGRFALSGSDDDTLKLWDVSEWTQAE